MKNIIFLFCLLLLTYSEGFGQNSIETNPSGTKALINVVGVGSTSVFSKKSSVYATTGSTSINNDLSAITGYASNSSTLNIGVFGFADGPNSQNNYGIYGSSNVLNGGGIGVMGTTSLSGPGGDNAAGGSFTAYGPIRVNGNANAVGVRAYVTGDGVISNRTGFESHVSGSSTSGSYGINASANNSGSSVTYGGWFSAFGIGNGPKYGIYSSASGSGTNIAAYLDGKVGIGTGNVSVNEILEINGRARLRRNSFASGLWFNNINNGTAPTEGAFVGLNNETSGSESLGIWLNGAFRLWVNRDGNTNVGEINRSQTSDANLVPIAYGNINADGTINSASSTNNFSVTKNSLGVYLISISGEAYNYLNYSTSATVVGYQTYGFIATNDSGTGALAITTASTSGNQSDRPFTFVVFKK